MVYEKKRARGVELARRRRADESADVAGMQRIRNRCTVLSRKPCELSQQYSRAVLRGARLSSSEGDYLSRLYPGSRN